MKLAVHFRGFSWRTLVYTPQPMFRHLAQFAFVAVISLVSTGCAKTPTLTLHHAEIQSASLFGLGLSIVLSVENPNSFDLAVRNVRAKVTIANRYELPIDYSPNQWLPAGKKTLVPVPVTIPYALLPDLANTTSNLQVLEYSVVGSVDVTATSALEVEKDNYPIDEKGSIQRADLFRAAGLMR